ENRGERGWAALFPRRAAAKGLFLTGLPHVDDYKKDQDHHKQQGGYRVELRAHPAAHHAVDLNGKGGGRTGGEVGDDEVVDAHGEGDEGAGDDARLDLWVDHVTEKDQKRIRMKSSHVAIY